MKPRVFPSSNTHVMIDLETMANTSDAAIVAIGAVRFEPLGPQLPEPPAIPTNEMGFGVTSPYFYANVKLESSMFHGLHVNADTIMWWLKQAPAAREQLLKPNPLGLSVALQEFNIWYGMNPMIPVWSHATFDFPILANAYRMAGEMDMPCKYVAARDVRTIYDLAYPGNLVPAISVENKHNALWDAWRQAIGVQSCYQKLHQVIGG